MAKFSIKEKINAVKEYLNGNEGYHSIAQRIGVSRAVLRSWIRQYYHHGEQAFTNLYTNYTVQYKLDVLKYIKENGTSSIHEAAANFNIPSHSTILKWQKNLETLGIDALIPKKRGAPP